MKKSLKIFFLLFIAIVAIKLYQSVFEKNKLFKNIHLNSYSRISAVKHYRPSMGEYRHQNLIDIKWDISKTSFSHDRYYIYRSELSGKQNFMASCETECAQWLTTPAECCKVSGRDSRKITFKGLYPNQSSFFVVRASDGSNIENNTSEKNVTTGTHPSGMVLVHYIFNDIRGGKYTLYVDFTEAGCEKAHYNSSSFWCDSGTGRASGDMVDPPRPGYSPYVEINQIEAASKCSSVNIPGYDKKRLPTWKEFIVASSWTPDPWDLTSTGNQLYRSIEDARSKIDCNTTGRHGHGNDPTTGFLTFVTGSSGPLSTEACVSYWGAQDMIGNLWEWLIDQVECSGTSFEIGYCFGKANGIDNSVLGWGYCSDDNLDGSCDYPIDANTMIIDNFKYTEEMIQKFSGSQFDDTCSRINSFSFEPDFFGITSVSNSNYDLKFNDDGFWRRYSSSKQNLRGALAGGHWYDGNGAGRFAINLRNPPTSTPYDYGFRCVLPVPQ